MLVSFIIVAYNAAPVLPDILRDLTAQDYDHGEMEILLVDSRSDDGTRAVFEKFQKDRKSVV